MTQSFDIAELVTLAKDHSPESRSRLFGLMGDLFLNKGGYLSSEERTNLSEILSTLLPQADKDSRLKLAYDLSGSTAVPHELARRIAEDEIEVASPILFKSTKLTDKDLIELAARSPQHAGVIATRRGLPMSVADTLMRSGQVDVVQALLDNASAQISIAALHTALEKSKTSDELQDSISRRVELPEEIAAELMEWAGDRVRERLMDRFNILMVEIVPTSEADEELPPLDLTQFNKANGIITEPTPELEPDIAEQPPTGFARYGASSNATPAPGLSSAKAPAAPVVDAEEEARLEDARLAEAEAARAKAKRDLVAKTLAALAQDTQPEPAASLPPAQEAHFADRGVTTFPGNELEAAAIDSGPMMPEAATPNQLRRDVAAERLTFDAVDMELELIEVGESDEIPALAEPIARVDRDSSIKAMAKDLELELEQATAAIAEVAATEEGVATDEGAAEIEPEETETAVAEPVIEEPAATETIEDTFIEEAAIEEAIIEDAVVEEMPVEETAVEETVVEETAVEEAAFEEMAGIEEAPPAAEPSTVEASPAVMPSVDEPVAEEPPAEELVAEELPAEAPAAIDVTPTEMAMAEPVPAEPVVAEAEIEPADEQDSGAVADAAPTEAPQIEAAETLVEAPKPLAEAVELPAEASAPPTEAAPPQPAAPSVEPAPKPMSDPRKEALVVNFIKSALAAAAKALPGAAVEPPAAETPAAESGTTDAGGAGAGEAGAGEAEATSTANQPTVPAQEIESPQESTVAPAVAAEQPTEEPETEAKTPEPDPIVTPVERVAARAAMPKGAEHKLTTALVIAVLNNGGLAHAEAMFAQMTGLRIGLVRRLAAESGGEGLAMAARAIHMSREDFSTIYLLWRKLKSRDGFVPTSDHGKALDFFDGAPQDRVLSVINRWRKDPEKLFATG